MKLYLFTERFESYDLIASFLQGGVRCSQFDNEKIASGSWDTTIMVRFHPLYVCVRVFIPIR